VQQDMPSNLSGRVSMSNLPPIPPPTGDMPPRLRRVDHSKPDTRLNVVSFVVPFLGCLAGPREISLIIGSFWHVLLLAALAFPFMVPAVRLRRGRQVFVSILMGL
jgi:hypothetical protein